MDLYNYLVNMFGEIGMANPQDLDDAIELYLRNTEGAIEVAVQKQAKQIAE